MLSTKNIQDKILTQLINKWGMTKFVKVIAATLIGAGASAILAESLIPDEPELIDKGEDNDENELVK